MLPREHRASLNTKSGKYESKGKIKPSAASIPTGKDIQLSRQQEQEILHKLAGQRSIYLHESTLSKPFGNIKTPKKISGITLQLEDRKAITKLAFQKKLENRKRRPRKPRVSISELRIQILARDGHRCRYCGTIKGPFHIDHVIPWSKGGTDTEDNLVTACQRCNLKKGTQTWIPRLP